ncbi:MAG: bifunctional diaminohydroxyphosphoribosylaminopyrimidine deaminase/5-amino-6-(5-phosphoribosylamino)uracil reductase RibD [Gammaproteobacteria bacterium]|nr:bifunctional diaminohydroxyphosphoribosylaminopyrimidine deaminase/5-amino-6-(5-phosphoribosylamino)uracil reductase RibD [Gammaproteobacteria bacterium]
MIQESDLIYLRATVELAEGGLYSCTPNPRVGCIIIRDGLILGRGWHVRAGQAHAEVNAMNDALSRGYSDLRGATVYVSLEPCSFHGRTPPCSESLIRAKVGRVVAAMSDPHPKVLGQGFTELRNAGIDVDLIELPEARSLNAGYGKRMTSGRPLVRLKVATSLDGRTAMASGESQWITGDVARADGQYWRARSCAIVTGIGTVLADNPKLTVRDERFAVEGSIRQPVRVIVDTRLRTPPEAELLHAQGEVLMAHGEGAESQLAGVEHIAMGNTQVDLNTLLEKLGERGCNEVLVEAGATLLGSFITEQLWDELIVYLAPRFLGSDAKPLAYLPLGKMDEVVNARIFDCTQVGDDLRIRLLPAETAHP